MEPLDDKLKLLKSSANLLIYTSVVLGAALLLQLYSLVPSRLFYSVLTGWISYAIIAVAAAFGRQVAYPAALILSILTLLVTLPQPEHYSLVAAGLSAASLTLIVGSAVQVAVIVTVASLLLLNRRRSQEKKAL